MSNVIPRKRSFDLDDPIFALNREARERKAGGEAIVNATIGVMLDDDGELAVLPTAAQVIRDVPLGAWAPYEPIEGSPAFLSAVLGALFDRDGADELRRIAIAVATPGGSGALRMAMESYAEPGQTILTTDSFWEPYQTLAAACGCSLATFAMFDERRAFNVAALDEAVGTLLARQGRVLLVLNDPCQNPTGYSLKDHEWEEIARVLAARASEGPITLLVDLAYAAYQTSDASASKHLQALAGKIGIAFAWSASKMFTHYGLRVGALVACVPDESARAETRAAFGHACRTMWATCSSGGLKAVTKLLADPEAVALCTSEREVLKDLLFQRHAAFATHAGKQGLRCPHFDGGFFTSVFSNDPLALFTRAKSLGVYVVPARVGVRIALCSIAARDVPRLVEALSVAVNDGAVRKQAAQSLL